MRGSKYEFLNDLISYWKFDGNAEDSHGSNDGTVSGATAISTGQKLGTGAYSFDGNNDYVDMDDIEQIDGSTEITFSAWMKLSSSELGGDGDLFTKGRHTTNVPLLIWRDDNVGKGDQDENTNCLSAFIDDGPNDKWISSPSGTLNDDDWHYIVVTFKADYATGLKIYIDGTLQQTGDTTNVDYIPENNDPFRVGADSTGGGQPLKGFVDEVAIWERVLEQDEVTALYNGGNGLGYSSFT